MDKVQRLRWLLASLATARWRPEGRQLAAQLGRQAAVDAASVTLSVEKTASDGEAIQIKLGSPLGELNVYASPTDRAALDSIRDARWSSRRSIRLGTVFGVPAWWSVDGDELTVLVGHDDETWDVAFTLPSTLLDDLKVQWAAA